MRKIVLLTIGLLSFGHFASAQTFELNKKYVYSLEGFYGREGLGVGLGFNFCEIEGASPAFKNFYLSTEVTKSGIGAGLGFKPDFKKWDHARFFKIIGVDYDYEHNFFVADDELVSQTTEEKPKMLVAFVLGPAFEIDGRIEIFFVGRLGTSWYPKEPLNAKSNGFYYYGWKAGVAINFGLSNSQ